MTDACTTFRSRRGLPAPSRGFVHIEKIGMTFATKKGPFVALRDIDLVVRRGEFVALIGHSGCGKSTLLNLVAGLLAPSHGVLLCAGREIAGPGPERGVVFQNHSLLPWLSCFDNVHLAVERVFGATESKADLKRRTHESLGLVGLAHAEHKFPHEISGGMKQRVGIARALAMQPKVMLLDEPFGALDALTRARLQDELVKIVAATASTVLMVTHDVDEAGAPLRPHRDDDQRTCSDDRRHRARGPAAAARARRARGERALPPLPDRSAGVPLPAAGTRRGGRMMDERG
jgi:nitrate/nitrite transport system ATP-binding protein